MDEQRIQVQRRSTRVSQQRFAPAVPATSPSYRERAAGRLVQPPACHLFRAPARFEAGTPNIADAVGLGAALDYIHRLGLPNIAAYEHELLQYATAGLSRIAGLRLIGTAREKVGVLSFVLPNRRTEGIGRMLDQEGIAVRAGHHCSQPSLRRFGVESTVRPSLSFYNTKSEIDRLVDAIKWIARMP
jgi:cysteine desulfurase / selenocysteine lyase